MTDDNLRAEILALGPALYWHCTERGGEVAYDLSGNNRDGDVGAGVTLGVTPGLDLLGGTAYRLASSTTGRVTLGDIGGLPVGAAPRSVVLRYRTGFTALGNAALFGYGENASATASFNIARTSTGNDRLTFWSWSNDATLTVPGVDLADGKDHTIVVVYDGATTITLYVDGVGGSATLGAPLNTGDGPLRLGATTDDGTTLPNEVVGHFAVFPYALTEEQVKAIHAAAIAAPVLPRLRVSWLPVDPTDDEVFVRYNVYRRRSAHRDAFGALVPRGPRVRIAAIPDIGTLECSDHGVGSGLGYEYSVTWTAIVDTLTLESDEQAVLVSATPEYRRAYLHDPAHPTIMTRVLASEVGLEQGQQQETLRARGRREDTVFIGEGFSRTFDLALIAAGITERGPYERLRAMVDRQFQGATYCLRIGVTGEVVYGRISSLRRHSRPGVVTPAAVFVETAYQEAV